MGTDAEVDRRSAAVDPVAAGRAALARGAWAEARTAFEAAVAETDGAEALEGLSWAAWWQADAPVLFDARQRAYRVYRSCGDDRGAARMAMWLGTDHVDFRGQLSVCNGWLERARRLLEGDEDSVEYGFLCIHEAEKALYVEDTVAAHALAGTAVQLGGRRGDLDLEIMGRATEGLVLVTEGEVDEGMRRLDGAAATALAGELRELWATSWCCCYVIYACERARDYGRAAEWCEHAIKFAEHHEIESFNRLCRAHYAGVLIWRGMWAEAEAELVAAQERLSRTRPPWAEEATVRLAELRRRQGRAQEAEDLFDQVEGHPLALVGAAELALDRGDAQAAADLLERFLREVPERSRSQRALALDVAVRARAALGDRDGAAAALAELRDIAEAIAGDALAGAASFAAGVIEAAAGDAQAARRSYDDAVHRFRRARAPFEAGRARLELARALAALDRREQAASEAVRAAEVLHQVGGAAEAARAEELAAQLAGRRAPSLITPREREVLTLVAAGKTDRAIAEQLVLSEHTVHRHVSNVLAKLGCSSRSAAVAEALRRGLL